MRRTDRDALRTRFAFRCGYCGVSESEAGNELTADHFRPVSRGGGSSVENLVYCCHACNEYKHDYWTAEPELQLLHPERDDPSVHLALSEDGTLTPLTARGNLHLRILRLNRFPLVQHRLEIRGREREREERLWIQEQFRHMENRVARLEAWIESNRTPL